MKPTLTDLLRRAAQHPDTGLRFLDRRERETWISWPQIYQRALSCAGGLKGLGVSSGDRIALILPTGIEFFDAFFGTLLAGAVPVPLYPPVRLGRLDEYEARTAAMLQAAGIRLVLTDRRVRRLLGPALASARPALGCRLVAGLSGVSSNEVEGDPDSLALVQFSSGTTREPKPVALTHRALVAQTRCLNQLWPRQKGRTVDSGVSWLPLYHDMGLIGCVFPALERPGTLTLLPPELFVARPAVWLRAISRYRATLSPAPNFAYGLCVEKIKASELEGVDLSCWRVALNGAEPVAPSVLRAFARRFAEWGFRASALTPVYGLSEAALAVTFSELSREFRSRRFHRQRLATEGVAEETPDGLELVSVGRPLPDFSVRVVGDDGRIRGQREVGRVQVSGPSLMEGYLGQPLATKKVLKEGWLDTGDLGFLVEGELYLAGRAKDVIIIRGRNHSPHEIEDAVNGLEGVRKGCVVAVSFLPEGEKGEHLLVLVEAQRGVDRDRYPVMAAACANAVRVATGLSAQRVQVLEPGTLPRTSSGKLQRQEALKRWLDDSLEPPRPVTPLTLAGAVARSLWATAISRREIGRGGRSR